jgi:hypothetical protein
MSNGAIFGRGISFPPRVGSDGRVAWSEGGENVRESIRVILMTEQRERLRLPEFGGDLKRFLFEPNTVTTHSLLRDRIERALEIWEPRVALESITVEADASDTEAAVASIAYKLVATQTKDRVDMTVRLNR